MPRGNGFPDQVLPRGPPFLFPEFPLLLFDPTKLGDLHTRESLLVRTERRWSSAKVIEALANVMVMKGVPEHIRSDNGPEFVAN